MPTLDSLADELRAHHNEICLMHDDEIVRLVGVAQDDHDLYYVVQAFGAHRKNKILWASAVGRIQPLKAICPAQAYARLESRFALNARPATEAFLVEDACLWDPDGSHGQVSRCGRFAILFDETRPEMRFQLLRRHEAGETFVANGEFQEMEEAANLLIRATETALREREEEARGPA